MASRGDGRLIHREEWRRPDSSAAFKRIVAVAIAIAIAKKYLYLE